MIICAFRRNCDREIAHHPRGVLIQRRATQPVGTIYGIPVHCNTTAEAISCPP